MFFQPLVLDMADATVTVTAVTFHPRRYGVYVDGELYKSTEIYQSERVLTEVMEEFAVEETNRMDVDYDYWTGAPETLEEVEEEFE